MRFTIQQKLLSWTDSYVIYDEHGKKAYTVRAKLISLTGHNLIVTDRYGEEVGHIREKIVALLPTYEISIKGQMHGTVHKKITLMKPKYHVHYHGWDVSGDIMGWNYDIKAGFRKIAKIHKKLLKLRNTYVIDVHKDEDALLALMLVIAIDATNCEKHEN